MQRVSFLAVLGIILFAITSPSDATIDPAKEKEIRSKIGVLQIPFIKNESQIKDSRVKYYANTFAGTVFITDDEIVYALRGENPRVRPGHGGEQQAVPKKDYRRSGLPSARLLEAGLRSFVGAPLAAPSVGANPRVRPEGCIIKEKFLDAKKTEAIGIKEAETKVSYFKGNDPNNWKSNIQTYQEIGLGEIYDHIKLNLKAYGKNIENLFIVEKGGKPEDITVKIEGAKGLKVNEKGELEVETDLGTIKMTKPVAYQEIEGKRVDVAVNYMLQPPPNPQSPVPNPELRYAFNMGDYNKDYPLVIDPLLGSTFLGGSSYDWAYALDIDSSGNVFVVGTTSSSDYPTTIGAYDVQQNGGDVFISKLNNSLTTLLASTFIGGSNSEYGPVILKLDSSGNVFIAGKTGSDNYPITPGAYNTSSKDGFISKLDNNLTSLLASTFLGGSFNDYFTSLAFDSSGNVFVGGYTDSSDFPTTPEAYDTSYGGGDADIFISKLNSTLSSLLASTFLGEEGNEQVNVLVIDSSENVYITGNTNSFNYPVTPGAYDTSYNGSYDVFVSKLDNNLSTILASTFIGGSQEDRSSTIILDSFGNVFIAGQTMAYPGISSYYPVTPGAYDTSINGYIDVFVSKLNGNLTNLISSTFIGGGAGTSESASTIALDSSGNVFIAGELRWN